MLTTRGGVRALTPADLEEFLALAGQDPVVNVFAIHRAMTTNLDPRWLGGEMWGRYERGELVAACHAAANLVPVQAGYEDAVAFARRAASGNRTASTIVGPQDSVRAFWEGLGDAWGTPREHRWDQRHLVLSGPPRIAPDRRVRFSDRGDMEALYPACVAMYTEEVGISPQTSSGSGDLYRARVAQLINRGWSFVRYDGDEIVFKAEVAWATPECAQVQGVWVPTHRRGEGLASAGMAAVVALILEEVAPTVSLYVNEWNLPARNAYEAVGFEETARFATVMF